MVVLAEIKNLNFKYPEEQETALLSSSLIIEEGDFLVLAGSSGSGKTTLLRHLKEELWPIGERTGEILYQGERYQDLTEVQSATEIGMVFQNPENQIVMNNVMGELAFSLENIGCPPKIIEKRIAELISFLGFQNILEQSIHTLSGGQKQLVNLASVLILQPKLLVLDEPTAQLDPIATRDFLGLLKRIHEELGITIVMSEHRLDEVIPMATRLVMMEDGKIIENNRPETVVGNLWQERGNALFIPQVPRLFLEMGSSFLPFSVLEGQRNLPRLQENVTVDKKADNAPEREPILKAKSIAFQYEKNGRFILRDLNFSIAKGEWVGIVGKNGTGKSTFLMVLAGLLNAQRGKVTFAGRTLNKIDLQERYERIGYVSQNPAYHFAYDTVFDEFYQRAIQIKLPQPEEAVQTMLQELQITHVSKRNPLDCSGGEQQLVSLGLVLLSKPEILLLDEPTKGLDPVRKHHLGELLKSLQAKGTTLVMATHDMEFAAAYGTRAALLFDGKILSEASVADFFSDNFFYTTSINRLVRKYLPQALTWEDVIPHVENSKEFN
ncbi:ABC transporter ATP-binding protein [Brochothrix thermosphacta]|uniref:ABC transporter ATP-binding protein n=1 Tax=Brochothrix thermosphacta TaxID=2756 RepID=UPI00083FCE44|nr:ABC transporter ATP-binding protein [Brochothrix thermosphacta]ODJ59350.1 cobalt ABC transporter ATP-binding protein [Brochothrix thermosphacta]